MLVQHFALRAGAQPLPLGELDALTVHLLALTPEVRSRMLAPGRQGHSTKHFVIVSQTCIHPALRRHASACRSSCIAAFRWCAALGHLTCLHAVSKRYQRNPNSAQTSSPCIVNPTNLTLEGT